VIHLCMSEMSMLTSGVDRARFSDQVALKLRLLIERDELRPGEQLPSKRHICDRLGVRRTVVREAICALEQSGLISIEPGRGTFVVLPGLHTIVDSLAHTPE